MIKARRVRSCVVGRRVLGMFEGSVESRIESVVVVFRSKRRRQRGGAAASIAVAASVGCSRWSAFRMTIDEEEHALKHWKMVREEFDMVVCLESVLACKSGVKGWGSLLFLLDLVGGCLFGL